LWGENSLEMYSQRNGVKDWIFPLPSYQLGGF
jgi:hypothetical protein